MNKKPTVIDFFCGAGGFSEGFRQQGFKIVMGIDNWRPALESHNLNHGLNDVPKDILDFENSLDEIHKLPNTEVIIGSPPCVLFSMSNRAGKSDKTLGIRLIEAYLRVITVKKYQKKSCLQAWFLENVPNSRKYIKPRYTFKDLGLEEWARGIGKKPLSIALEIERNNAILNAADYGAAQRRHRFVCGEIINLGQFILPEKTQVEHKKLRNIKNNLPKPISSKSNKIWTDPNYPQLCIPSNQITDHFYDTGIYESYWRNTRDYKLNHPYMGKMSFPEDENNPSRTIMATRSTSSREALIYKSEYARKGNGEYRTPTIREIACLMGFPLVYQFVRGEATKWRQIGNAVPIHLSGALAKTVRISMGFSPIAINKISFRVLMNNYTQVPNLNTYKEVEFNNPPKRKALSRFRRHPFKEGNMTVALTNYNPATSSRRENLNWYSAVFYGTGKGFAVEILRPDMYKYLQRIILRSDGNHGKRFIADFNRRFSSTLNKVKDFQNAYENPKKFNKNLNPDILVDKIADLICSHNIEIGTRVHSPEAIAGKSALPVRQLYAMYAINKLISQQKV